MAETAPASPAPAPAPTAPSGSSVGTRFVLVAIVAVVAYLGGFVPWWLKSRTATHRAQEMRRELAISQIENKIAAATLDANRGQHEQARRSASQFFTQLRDEIDQEANSTLTPSQREQAKQLLNQRDEIITLLARSDPGSAKKLSDIYVAFRNLFPGPAQK